MSWVVVIYARYADMNGCVQIIQKLVPESLERVLPNSLHNTGDSSSSSAQSAKDQASSAAQSAKSTAKEYGVGETHAAKGGEDSYVPKAAQKAVPEAVEKAIPDAVHNTSRK